MRKLAIVVIVLALLALGFIWYRSRSSIDGLDVDPRAGREIEKAKRR